MATIPLLSVRVAPLSGKISWATYQSITIKLNQTSYTFAIQTTRWFAFAENLLYKPWRIVMRKQYQWVGHVVAEFEKKSDAINALIEIKQLFDTEFEKFINNISDLKHGDVLSVPTKMMPGGGLRHFGIFDEENNQVIEYQPDTSAKKGSIQSTPFDVFCERVRKEYNGKLDLRKHKYMKQDAFPDKEVVSRARKQINQSGYNAIFKNCETFAVWCKLGNAQSIQSRQYMTIILDGALKVGAFVAVVVVVAGIIYFVGPEIISLAAATGTAPALASRSTNISTEPPAGSGIQVSIDANKGTVQVVGTDNCPVSDGCKAVMKGGGAIGFGVAPVVLGAGTCLQLICDDRKTFTAHAAVQEEKLQLLDDERKVNVNIIKEGSVYIQFGLCSSMQSCWIMVTDKCLVIDRKNCAKNKSGNPFPSTICIDWTKLLNIDDLNGDNGAYSLQLWFKDEMFPSIYIYGASKSEKKKWLGIFKKICCSVLLTKELQSVKSYAAELGFSQCQIEQTLTKYHQQYGTLYNFNAFIGAISNDEENQNY